MRTTCSFEFSFIQTLAVSRCLHFLSEIGFIYFLAMIKITSRINRFFFFKNRLLLSASFIMPSACVIAAHG